VDKTSKKIAIFPAVQYCPLHGTHYPLC